MKVELAECAGACYGVKRALQLAFESTHDGIAAQTLGPLIHNPAVVENLRLQGIDVADTVDDVTAERVIIRSHGITPEVHDQLQALDVGIVDATCPHVVRAQQAAFELAKCGFSVLIVGESAHPEVQGLCAWARRGSGRVVVVESPADIPETLEEPVGIVVQTTQPREVLDSIVDALHNRGITPEVRDTICSSTSKRQKAAAELAKHVDAMVVVGGHNSSNTTRLYEICSRIAPRAFHVETADELLREDFADIAYVGVSAGASTPDDQIAAVVDCLRSWR